MPLSFERLLDYVGEFAGIRSRSRLEPLAGPGSKIFPPTYGVADNASTKYAVEARVVRGPAGETVVAESVVLNSVAAQAHELSAALLEAAETEQVAIPLIGVDFTEVEGLAEFGMITDLQSPHRVYDAIHRDSLDGDVPFRFGPIGRAITDATVGKATALFVHSPSALLFGAWDSTGPKGGRGTKFERAITSEIVANGIARGVRTSSRLDPLGVEKVADIYRTPAGEWTLDPAQADAKTKSKPLRPSEINHGNVAPSIDERAGGVTAAEIEATTVLSLIHLRRLRFPVDAAGTALTGARRQQAETAARATLAALGLAATALAFEAGFDLRSRCVLAPTTEQTFEAVGRSGAVEEFTLGGAEGLALVTEAAAAAAAAGLSWRAGVHSLTPTPRLVDLVRRSKAAAVAETAVAD
ncbi:type I-U CRISPR-associated RAMP protein Csb1/Cas7u [Skermania piniformis]|uniref:Type I-U CRISPR-associated protein Cas7 n=1 Tax=Skermania pinensis TaxID=39122 RepID=A0ABX8SA56_9ACTN|nr:type I-U CRISPR-associated RAMP protein Csb1/Cas7u [Skermania piniformis]QXQ13864.1 type I-U CRISPR-associated protein Cas7 [Skermania piniformis]